MGIKHLNRFLLERCSTRSIHKLHLGALSGQTIIIDTNIYLYKYVEKNALLENMYLMISIFKHYNITPVYVFDGKPPPEKKELLERRRNEKRAAEEKFNVLKREMADTEDVSKREDIVMEMEMLKKKFVRIRDQDIHAAKTLMTAYGIMYLESYGEADQLCAYLTTHKYAWACMSDDMDMFVYGCPRVLRHMSLINHTVIFYDTERILDELNMSFETFKQILVLSGTDYNMSEKVCLWETIKWYGQYIKHTGGMYAGGFYGWLDVHSKYIDNRNKLDYVYSLFDLGLFSLKNMDEIRETINQLPFRCSPTQFDTLRNILTEDGFLFP